MSRSIPPQTAACYPEMPGRRVFPNGTLIVTNVQRQSDAGTYTCVARNAHGFMARANLGGGCYG